MGRIRTIKPEFPQSESIGKLSRDARLLFIQLWTLVDDSGRARGASRMLASLLYPYDDDAPALIEGWMGELVTHGFVQRYQVDGTQFIEIDNWRKHQKIDHPAGSKFPGYSISCASPREDIAKPREPSREPPSTSRAFAGSSEIVAPDLGPRTLDKEEDREKESKRIPLSEPAKGARKPRTPGVYAGSWDFEAFWGAYPRKSDKGEARKAMLQVERSGVVTFEAMMAGIANIEASEPQYVKHPATWLRAEAWGNAPVERAPPKGAPVPFKAKAAPRIADYWPANIPDQDVVRMIRGWVNRREWDRSLFGPAPGEKLCAVPKRCLELADYRRPAILNMGNGHAEHWDTTTPPPHVEVIPEDDHPPEAPL